MLCPACGAENLDGALACFICGRALSALTQGAVLAGRYEIRSTLGQGGMGIVYKAFDRVLEEAVAIKVLRADAAHDGEAARRFRSEIRLARKVSHRNVCRIHEYNEDRGFRYISMEFVDGMDLRQLLREKGRLDHREGFDIAIQLGHGLAAIHEVGVIHRDLKTRNVMLDRRGVVRLMDFGIAKQFGADTSTGMTATGLIVGTPEYMSPEQARGEKIDFRSDVYAFGIVIFEIFTGQVPFRGDTPLATIFKHFQDPPPLDEPVAAPIPIGLKAILRQALAKTPGQRFPDVQSLVHALSAVAPEIPFDAVPAPPPTASVEPEPTQVDKTPSGGSLPAPARATAAAIQGEPAVAPTPVRAATETMKTPPTPAPLPTAVAGRPTRRPDDHPTPQPPPQPERASSVAPPVVPQPAPVPPTVVSPASISPAVVPPTIIPRSVAEPTVRTPWPTPKPRRSSGLPMVFVGGLALTVVVIGVIAFRLLRSPETEPSNRDHLPPPTAVAVSTPDQTPPPEVAPPATARPAEKDVDRGGPPRAAVDTVRATVAPRPTPTSRPVLTLGSPVPNATTIAPTATPLPTAAPTPFASAPATASVTTPSPPTPAATPVPTPPPRSEPSPTAPPSTFVPEMGYLSLAVFPWADVVIDGKPFGQTPRPKIPLEAGQHVVVLNHTNYQPLKRKVTIKSGETLNLSVNLPEVGVPKK